MFAVVAGKPVQMEKAGGGYDDFRRNIRAAVRGLWGGNLDMLGFLESMNRTIQRSFTIAWREGAQAVGIRSDEQNDDEKNALNIEINNDLMQTMGFANAIVKGSKANGGKLSPLLYRSEMWINRYTAIVSRAMSMAGRDKKLKWVWSPIKEHCGSCLKLNGRVYRASTWAKYDLRPKMHRLQCKGFR